MYQALQAQKQIRPKAEDQWRAVLLQSPKWSAVWETCHKGLNTGQENEVCYLTAHRVVKTSAYLKFKCGMKSVSEFCVRCGQIEDLEHLFIECETVGRVWKEFTPILRQIVPGEVFTDKKILLLRDFQHKHPKRATLLATYLMKMILHKIWRARCISLFDKKQLSARDIIQQIQTELRQCITISFYSNRSDISKQMLVWRHKDILCTLSENNKLIFRFHLNHNSASQTITQL